MSPSPDPPRHVPLAFERLDPDEQLRRARAFRERMRTRRSVRHFSPDPVPLEAVRACIDAAAQAPSGANRQPWTFVLVTDAETKRRIREAAEAEERAFYGGRAPRRWIEDLEPLGTRPEKPFLETAPVLIAVFAHRRGERPGERNYYVSESVGIATGLLLAALHHAGFATLTHTPSPMGFLGEILGRPRHERAWLLVPVGYPAPDCRVPDIARKTRAQYLVEV